MRRPRLFGRVLVVGLLVSVILPFGGAGNAYWSAGGTGVGTGSTGTDQAVGLTPGTANAGLYPGGTADIVVGVTNPGTSPVRVESLGLDTSRGDGGFTVDASHSACSPLSVLDVAAQTNGGDGWDVPAPRAWTSSTTRRRPPPGPLATPTGSRPAFPWT
jgi:hypothetical protein